MFSPATPSAFAPAPPGPLTLRNQIIKAATIEGARAEGFELVTCLPTIYSGTRCVLVDH